MRKPLMAVLGSAIAVVFAAACTQPGPSTPPSRTLQTGICYSIAGDTQSFVYLGPANTLANSLLYPDSSDCSTTAANNSESAVLIGMADEAAAGAHCDLLLPVDSFVSSLSVLEPITPELNSSDYWGCFVL